MDSQYYVNRASGEKDGPYDESTIRQMVNDGQIVAGDRLEDTATGTVWEPSVFFTPPSISTGGAPKKKVSPVIWILVAAVVLLVPCAGILAAILFPVFVQAKQSAQMTATMTDLKRVGLGLSVYQADFDDLYPPKTDSLASSWRYIGSYVKGPMIESKNPNNRTIVGNPSLAGRVATKVPQPNRTLAFFDSSSWPNNRRIILFADTSVRRVRETEVTDALVNHLVMK